MPDYKEMYYHLFRETAKAIEILQKAQQKTEELYISASPSTDNVIVVDSVSDFEKENS